MDKTEIQKNNTDTKPNTGDAKTFPQRNTRNRRGPRGGDGKGKGGDRRGGSRRPARPRSEFDHKVISVRRVTRVVSGGRRFSFSVGIIAGDRKGRVGVGMGKAGDTALAIEKAMRDAEKNMISIKLTKASSIAHDVEAKYASSRVIIMPAKERGLIAGSSVRTVLELAGVKDVGAKIFSRSKNKVNNARVAIVALSKLS